MATAPRLTLKRIDFEPEMGDVVVHAHVEVNRGNAVPRTIDLDLAFSLPAMPEVTGAEIEGWLNALLFGRARVTENGD